MKKIILLLVIGSGCITAFTKRSAEPNPIEVKENTLIPEGVAVHPISGDIYLSSLHHNKIVRVNKDGSVQDVIASNANDYMWGLGMKFSCDGNTLWSCSANGAGETGLFMIDIVAGKVQKRFDHDSARFLNDLMILRDGRIFITDTQQGAVFLFHNNKMELWLKDAKLMWANGITASADDRHLFVASGRHGLQKITIADKTITSATQDKRTDYAIDGLVFHNNTLYAAIGWPQDQVQTHRILRYYLNNELNFIKADTLAIDQPNLTCPTTLAIHNNELYALGNTNLGIYNRHQQKVDKIMDSLSYPIVTKFTLK